MTTAEIQSALLTLPPDVQLNIVGNTAITQSSYLNSVITENNNLTGSLAAAIADRDRELVDLITVQGLLSGTQVSLAQAQAQTASLTSSVSTLQTTVSNLQSGNAAMLIDLNTYKTLYSGVSSGVSSANLALADSQNQLIASQNNVSRLSGTISGMQFTINTLSGTINQLNLSLVSGQNTIDFLKLGINQAKNALIALG